MFLPARGCVWVCTAIALCFAVELQSPKATYAAKPDFVIEASIQCSGGSGSGTFVASGLISDEGEVVESRYYDEEGHYVGQTLVFYGQAGSIRIVVEGLRAKPRGNDPTFYVVDADGAYTGLQATGTARVKFRYYEGYDWLGRYWSYVDETWRLSGFLAPW